MMGKFLEATETVIMSALFYIVFRLLIMAELLDNQSAILAALCAILAVLIEGLGIGIMED